MPTNEREDYLSRRSDHAAENRTRIELTQAT